MDNEKEKMVNLRQVTDEMLKKLIAAHTDNKEPMMGEPACVIWKAEHKNCKGCDFQLSCGKLAGIMMVSMLGAMYKPKNFQDELDTMSVVTGKMDKIMKAKSNDEIHKITSLAALSKS